MSAVPEPRPHSPALPRRYTSAKRISAILFAVGTLAACASGASEGKTNSTPSPVSAISPATQADAPAQEAPPAASPPSAADEAPTAGIFTEAQAERGRSTFDDVCGACHTTSEFRGRAFLNGWGRRTVYSFYRTIRSTMPDDNPGGLDEQLYLDVSSYVLRLNGHSAGSSELTRDSPMRDVRMAPPEPEN